MKRITNRHTVVPAVYVIFRQDGKILLIRRAGTGYRDGEYSLPAGHVGGTDEQGGETAIRAAVREAKEEVGVDIAPEDLRLVHTMHRKSTNPTPHERMDLYFEAVKWHGTFRNAEPHKCDELRWADATQLPDNMVPEVRQALAKIFAHQNYSNFGF
jgi:8-oxo-dGTP diphosphatase